MGAATRSGPCAASAAWPAACRAAGRASQSFSSRHSDMPRAGSGCVRRTRRSGRRRARRAGASSAAPRAPAVVRAPGPTRPRAPGPPRQSRSTSLLIVLPLCLLRVQRMLMGSLEQRRMNCRSDRRGVGFQPSGLTRFERADTLASGTTGPAYEGCVAALSMFTRQSPPFRLKSASHALELRSKPAIRSACGGKMRPWTTARPARIGRPRRSPPSCTRTRRAIRRRSISCFPWCTANCAASPVCGCGGNGTPTRSPRPTWCTRPT